MNDRLQSNYAVICLFTTKEVILGEAQLFVSACLDS